MAQIEPLLLKDEVGCLGNWKCKQSNDSNFEKPKDQLEIKKCNLLETHDLDEDVTGMSRKG